MQKPLEQTNSEPGGDRAQALRERIEAVRARISAALKRAGRSPGEVGLIAVSKTHPSESIRLAQQMGMTEFGENRVQEALPKIEALGAGFNWHLIGHLQRNKAREVAGRFGLIHSVDSPRLIAALDDAAARAGVIQPILFQISLAGETQKSGAQPDELPELLSALAAAPHLRGEGLMTVPPYDDDPEASRCYFRRLRDLLGQTEISKNFNPRHLSMGMSGDFEVAIEEGSTWVRVGTAIFGERP